MKRDVGDACEFDDVTVSLLAETSTDGDEWGRWVPSTAIDREEPRTGSELRKVLRTYGRTVANAISTTPHETRWVRVVARCVDTGRTLGMDIRAFDWITRGYLESPARSWIICDNVRECDQWRVQRLTARMGSWGAKGNAAKHAKARPTWYAKRTASVGLAALVVFAVGSSALMPGETDRPPSFAAPEESSSPTPEPTRTEVVKVVEVRVPDGSTVTVPVNGTEEETRKAIQQVVNKTLEGKRHGKGSTASPTPSESSEASETPKSAPEPTDRPSETSPATPTPTPDAGHHNEGEGPPKVMPVNVVISAVLPRSVDDAPTRVLSAPPPELQAFSAQLAAMGTVTDQQSVQQHRTIATGATVAIKGAAEPVTVAAAVTKSPLNLGNATVEVATAEGDDTEPTVTPKEEAPARTVDETVSRVGVEAVMDAVKSEE